MYELWYEPKYISTYYKNNFKENFLRFLSGKAKAWCRRCAVPTTTFKWLHICVSKMSLFVQLKSFLIALIMCLITLIISQSCDLKQGRIQVFVQGGGVTFFDILTGGTSTPVGGWKTPEKNSLKHRGLSPNSPTPACIRALSKIYSLG